MLQSRIGLGCDKHAHAPLECRSHPYTSPESKIPFPVPLLLEQRGRNYSGQVTAMTVPWMRFLSVTGEAARDGNEDKTALENSMRSSHLDCQDFSPFYQVNFPYFSCVPCPSPLLSPAAVHLQVYSRDHMRAITLKCFVYTHTHAHTHTDRQTTFQLVRRGDNPPSSLNIACGTRNASHICWCNFTTSRVERKGSLPG